MASRAAVWIGYTGGTIGMRPTPEGLAPAPGHLVELLAQTDELRHDDVPRFFVHEFETLVDSAWMEPADWLGIAREIERRREDFDGFVVLHGTDTLAYTASALSFLLRGLGKPVLLTGSQIALSQTRSDGWDNLITSLLIAGRPDLAEVSVYFDHLLLRGNRTVKVDADRFHAFDSPAYPVLGEAGVGISIRPELLVRSDAVPIDLPASLDARLAVLRVFPGMSADVFEHFLAAPLDGVVIETYGAGTAPRLDDSVYRAIAHACARGVVPVAVSQCPRGTVDLGRYAAGTRLARAGVVSGADMTTEAALTKLYTLFAEGLDSDEIRHALRCNLAGELTESHEATN